MSHDKTNLTVLTGGGSLDVDAVSENGIKSPKSPPGAALSPRERKVWDYICQHLREAGLEHLTGGLAIAVVCKVFIRYISTERELQEFEASNNGSYFVKTKSGFQQPHQLFYAANDLRNQLLKCLPETLLTLPAVVQARAKLGDADKQDDLFDAVARHANCHPSAFRN